MAAGRPTGAAGEGTGVIASADHDGAGRSLLLEVAFQAKGGVALGEHPLIDRAVRLMAGVAALAQRFVFENKWPPLHGVALETGLVRAGYFRSSALHRRAFVWIVAIRAAHLPFQDRVVMRQRELRADIQMALETGLGRFFRIHDRARAAPAAHVQTARTVTRLAADFLFAVSLRFQTRMGRGVEIAGDGLMARLATFRSGKLSPGDAGRRDERARRRGRAGNQNHGKRRARPQRPAELLTLTVDPSS